MSDTVSMTLGLDIRTAKVEHYRQVYDLLGGDFFYNSSNPNWSEEQRHRTLVTSYTMTTLILLTG